MVKKGDTISGGTGDNTIDFRAAATSVITAHPDYRATIHGRGGADVMTGSRQPDRLGGGNGFDIRAVAAATTPA